MTATDNREAFLNGIAEKLGRERRRTGVERPERVHTIADTTLAGKTQDELLAIAKGACSRIHTDVVETSVTDLAANIEKIATNYGNESVLIADDPRFEEFGLQNLANNAWDNCVVSIWKEGRENRAANIATAADSNIAIAFADFLLAESGSVVVESSPKQGRTLHFLPVHYIAIVPKSKIVPRSTQAADYYDARIASGQEIGSSINFISGPSNSGDIEMQLVVGVHGPISVTYVVVTDK
ncbi:LutC/YkgG family protein [Listeria grandensis]|uniref:LutC/YkgG family protein n=1 Tax=Listeria grandensis TaxID=1494963 RepID=UPI00164DD4C5|nr:lactate utilization protein C [Listeria grandensis]MBC6315259.1 lactate utilization protein C [Listeria grandensis]